MQAFGIAVAEHRNAVLHQERRQDHPPQPCRHATDKIADVDQRRSELDRGIFKWAEQQRPEDIGDQHRHQHADDTHKKAKHQERHLFGIADGGLLNLGGNKPARDPFAKNLYLDHDPDSKKRERNQQRLPKGPQRAIGASGAQDIDDFVDRVGQLHDALDQSGAELVAPFLQVHQRRGVSCQRVLWLGTLAGSGGRRLVQQPACAVDDHHAHAAFGSLFDDLLQPCGVGICVAGGFFLRFWQKG